MSDDSLDTLRELVMKLLELCQGLAQTVAKHGVWISILSVFYLGFISYILYTKGAVDAVLK